MSDTPTPIEAPVDTGSGFNPTPDPLAQPPIEAPANDASSVVGDTPLNDGVEAPVEAPPADTQPVTSTEQSETAPEVVNDPNAPRDVAPADVDGDPLAQPPTGEEIAANRMAEDSHDISDVNQLGDQDAVNLGYNYPPGVEVPTAQNVRRYPELFTQEVIDSFNVPDPNAPVE